MTKAYHILTLATLFPNATKPNFGIFVERQTNGLSNSPDFDVTVINPLGIPPWPLSTLERYKDLKSLPAHENWNGLNIYRPRFTLIPAIGGALNPRLIANAILPLIKKLHNEKPFDLIDAEFFYPDGPAAMHIAREIGIPFSIKSRGADIHYWSRARGCKSQILKAADKAAGLLSVSAALKRDMGALGMDEDKVTVHYTGIDHSKFYPRERSAGKKKLGVKGPLLVCVAALIERKNQDLIIKAIAKIPDATLIFAGMGPARAQFENLAQALGVADRVRFLGAVPHDQLPEIIAAADISCLVSESEGLANAWVESLASGTPLVISDVGGARELVRSEIAGHIVDKDVDNIVKAIRDLIENPRDQKDVKDSVSHFSWDQNSKNLRAYFHAILD